MKTSLYATGWELRSMSVLKDSLCVSISSLLLRGSDTYRLALVRTFNSAREIGLPFSNDFQGLRGLALEILPCSMADFEQLMSLVASHGTLFSSRVAALKTILLDGVVRRAVTSNWQSI